MPMVMPEKMEVTWGGGGGMGGLVVMEIGKRRRAKNSQPNVTENGVKRDVETERQRNRVDTKRDGYLMRGTG